MSFKKLLEHAKISDQARKNLSPESLRALEALIEDLKTSEPEPVTFTNPEKFDAKDMHPVGEPLVNWKGDKKPKK